MGVCLGIADLNQPFLSADHILQNYFLEPEYAIEIPVILLVLGLSVILLVISLVMAIGGKKKSNNKQKTS